MGIYIPKMEKPTDCGYCDFYRWGYCHVKHARVECEDGVDDDCPLVSVTEPHGRLIDEAEVRVTMYQVCARSIRTYEATECAIRNMKAVIEAEGE